MKRCKTCRFYKDLRDSGWNIAPCSNALLMQETTAGVTTDEQFFEPPSEDFGCTEHEPREDDD